MSALLLAGLLTAPLGFAAPPDPTDESVVVEPERVEVVTPTPAPEPEQPPPFDVAPAAFNLPPPPPPPNGNGRLVAGSFAIAFGLGAASAVVVETTREGGSAQFVAATFIPIGLASVGVGAYLLVRGSKARSNFNDWRAFTNHATRPTGDGLIVGGTASTLVGGVTLIAAGLQARSPDALDRPLTPTLLAVGATGVAVGVGALTFGLLRRGRYRTWRQSTFLTSLAPTISPIYAPGSTATFAELRGASFGFAGRL